MTFFCHGFWDALGWILEGFWEAKIIKFSIIFAIFARKNATRKIVPTYTFRLGDSANEKGDFGTILEAEGRGVLSV